MEGLLSLLLYAGLFYVMMRFGCGAHMMHGNKTGHNSGAVKRIDPVCGMEVDREQGYGIMHENNCIVFVRAIVWINSKLIRAAIFTCIRLLQEVKHEKRYLIVSRWPCLKLFLSDHF